MLRIPVYRDILGKHEGIDKELVNAIRGSTAVACTFTLVYAQAAYGSLSFPSCEPETRVLDAMALVDTDLHSRAGSTLSPPHFRGERPAD